MKKKRRKARFTAPPGKQRNGEAERQVSPLDR